MLEECWHKNLFVHLLQWWFLPLLLHMIVWLHVVDCFCSFVRFLFEIEIHLTKIFPFHFFSSHCAYAVWNICAGIYGTEFNCRYFMRLQEPEKHRVENWNETENGTGANVDCSTCLSMRKGKKRYIPLELQSFYGILNVHFFTRRKEDRVIIQSNCFDYLIDKVEHVFCFDSAQQVNKPIASALVDLMNF